MTSEQFAYSAATYPCPPVAAAGDQQYQQQQQQHGGYYPQSSVPVAVAYYPSTGPYQQQPIQPMVISQGPPTVVVQQPTPSFVLHIILSCVVIWCCGGLFGLAAFILAGKQEN